jgi:hypothetical protein
LRSRSNWTAISPTLVNLAQIRFAAGTPADLRASADLFKRALVIKPDVKRTALTVISLRLQDICGINTLRRLLSRLAVESGTPAHTAAARRSAAHCSARTLEEAEGELTAAAKLEAENSDLVVSWRAFILPARI